ncbi:Nn.00g102280.m01.CDS01 [Neocucurbitaria sp. VM-36]
MLFTQAKIGRSVSTTLAPHRADPYTPFPHDFLTCPKHQQVSKQRLRTRRTGAKQDTLREYAESCAEPYLTNATHEVGQRRMIQADPEHASSAETRIFQFTIPSQAAAQTTLTFDILSPSDMGLTFSPRPPPRPRKRSRAAADIDGEHSCLQKKKRRLRLFLITSRLSPQFSHPATNIVDRGSSKIAVWAKQRALGRNLLRKAAILNRIRRQTISARDVEDGQGRVLVEQEREQEQFELARLEFDHGSVDTYTRPVLSQTPSVPPAAAIRTGGHFVVSGSPSTSPSSSRSPSPTPPSPPLRGIADNDASEYRSPNEAYAHSPPRAQLPRRDYLPLPPSPLGLSNYDAFDADDDIPDPYSRFDDDDDEETQAPSYPFDDEEMNESPFPPTATVTTSSSTAQRSTTQVSTTPPQIAYADLNVLDAGEAVFGDYDQVDSGADTVWPSPFALETAPSTTTPSSSPDFPTLFATTSSTATFPTSKRTDSFATSPSFRPQKPKKSVSPNLAPSASASASPNFPTPASLPSTSISTSTSISVSPNFAPDLLLSPISVSTSTSVSPNLVPTLSTSPNFAAVDDYANPALPAVLLKREQANGESGGGEEVGRRRRNSDVEQERERESESERRRRVGRG